MVPTEKITRENFNGYEIDFAVDVRFRFFAFGVCAGTGPDGDAERGADVFHRGDCRVEAADATGVLLQFQRGECKPYSIVKREERENRQRVAEAFRKRIRVGVQWEYGRYQICCTAGAGEEVCPSERICPRCQETASSWGDGDGAGTDHGNGDGCPGMVRHGFAYGGRYLRVLFYRLQEEDI